jgi:hypothetical protein
MYLMSKTKAEIRDQAGQKLGLIRINGTLQDQDKTKIEAAYDEVYEILKKRSLATWASTGSVPTGIESYVSGLIALKLALDYSISLERYQLIASEVGVDGNEGYKRIGLVVIPEYESDDEPRDY